MNKPIFDIESMSDSSGLNIPKIKVYLGIPLDQKSSYASFSEAKLAFTIENDNLEKQLSIYQNWIELISSDMEAQEVYHRYPGNCELLEQLALQKWIIYSSSLASITEAWAELRPGSELFDQAIAQFKRIAILEINNVINLELLLKLLASIPPEINISKFATKRFIYLNQDQNKLISILDNLNNSDDLIHLDDKIIVKRLSREFWRY